MPMMEATKQKLKERGVQLLCGEAFQIEEEPHRIQFTMEHLPHNLVCEYDKQDGWATYLTASTDIVECPALDVAYHQLNNYSKQLNQEHELDQREFLFQFGFN